MKDIQEKALLRKKDTQQQQANKSVRENEQKKELQEQQRVLRHRQL